MTVGEARRWIAELEILGMRFGLERMAALLAGLDSPERTASALHVVGTNGKSSTARLASAALAGEGLRVGTYMSPHVTDWSERIQIQGAPIGEDAFAAAASEVRRAAEALRLPEGDAVTQFEALTAIAFVSFRRAAVDVAVVEAGLGGRYDATNVLQPRAAVALTNIALEHTELLGDTEAAIAAEKLAVCADGSDRLVVGRLTPAAAAAVEAECAQRGLRPLRFGEGLSVRQAMGAVEVQTPRATYAGLRAAAARRVPARQPRPRRRGRRDGPRARPRPGAACARRSPTSGCPGASSCSRALRRSSSTVPTTRPAWTRWPRRCARCWRAAGPSSPWSRSSATRTRRPW